MAQNKAICTILTGVIIKNNKRDIPSQVTILNEGLHTNFLRVWALLLNN